MKTANEETDEEAMPIETTPLLGPKTKYKPQKVQEEEKSCAEVCSIGSKLGSRLSELKGTGGYL